MGKGSKFQQAIIEWGISLWLGPKVELGAMEGEDSSKLHSCVQGALTRAAVLSRGADWLFLPHLSRKGILLAHSTVGACHENQSSGGRKPSLGRVEVPVRSHHQAPLPLRPLNFPIQVHMELQPLAFLFSR